MGVCGWSSEYTRESTPLVVWCDTGHTLSGATLFKAVILLYVLVRLSSKAKKCSNNNNMLQQYIISRIKVDQGVCQEHNCKARPLRLNLVL